MIENWPSCLKVKPRKREAEESSERAPRNAKFYFKCKLNKSLFIFNQIWDIIYYCDTKQLPWLFCSYKRIRRLQEQCK